MSAGVFQVVIAVEEDGDGYYAYCPDLDCIHVSGNSAEEALEAAREAVSIYISMSLKHGDPIPIGLTRDSQKRVTPPRRKPRSARQETRELIEAASHATA